MITEIPYQVIKSKLIEKIAQLLEDKKLPLLSDVRDESAHDVRIVLEPKNRTVDANLLMEHLFKQTELEVRFAMNMNVLSSDGVPKVMSLKEVLKEYLDHRHNVLKRKSKYRLDRIMARLEILSGYLAAYLNLDEVIRIIRASRDTESAKNALMERFSFDDVQAQAIVDMQLKRLTHLQIEDLRKELAELHALIAHLRDLLEHHEKILAIIKDETNELAAKYGDDRRTDIVADDVEQINVEDLIKEEDMVVIISKLGYIKRMAVSLYKNQGRGGKGSATANLVEDDFLSQVFVASTHDYVMFITNAGKAYWVKVHEIPEASKSSRGSHIKSLLQVSADEEITTVVTLKEFSETQYLFMATANGTVKKTVTLDFQNAKTKGIQAINLRSGDKLVSAILTGGSDELVLVTRRGKALRITEEEVRPMGRAAGGVAGIKLAEGDETTAAVHIEPDTTMLLVTEKGVGKRVDFAEFGQHGRGTGGQIVFGNIEGKGEIIGALAIKDSDEVMCITSQGKTLRVLANTISQQGRASTGIKVLDIAPPDYVIGIDKVANDEEEK